MIDLDALIEAACTAYETAEIAKPWNPDYEWHTRYMAAMRAFNGFALEDLQTRWELFKAIIESRPDCPGEDPSGDSWKTIFAIVESDYLLARLFERFPEAEGLHQRGREWHVRRVQRKFRAFKIIKARHRQAALAGQPTPTNTRSSRPASS